MNDDLIKWLASLGVGGAIAGFMFAFYRKDVREYVLQWKNQTEILITVVKENTAAITKLTVLIEKSDKEK